VNVRFSCPICDQTARLQTRGLTEWVCPACGHMVQVQPADDLSACAVCGNAELYKKKDFPHWLGLTILTAACVAFLVAHALYWPGVAWSILIASAVIDGAFYLWVGDALVCYRCGAQYRGVPASPHHMPFDLGVAERYRQERLRRTLLKDNRADHAH
jgi:DNA-directed RNA polymerase subunit RPC12/RpoP